MTDTNLATRMNAAGFAASIIQIQTGVTLPRPLHRKKASVTQLLPALPSFGSITADSATAEAAIALLMSYLEHWNTADDEVGVDALITAYEQASREFPGQMISLEQAWVIARECRCNGSSEVLNLLFSSYNQDR
ncbi:hypothetical protein APB26_32965 [Pseudomonas aeruginosa]|uniref:hypothetical protein n=1 Tax=Pseudomonas aeruginosa TaxID=287 RepID=UPI00071BEE94|nr:hypothetical protein [Pseudomonas aeruginosa]KSQ21792.1 hypothetical protein APB26_32965 [Pseudomonas aeruginosa]RPV61467.1 hypothetical protein IPC838_19310 [Pseudomonas aeruginosa]